MGRIENAAVRFGVEGARGPIAALAVAVVLLAAALAGGAGRAEAASPVAGDASWIWYVSDSGGSGAAIGRAARRHGLDAVYVKSGDGSSYWSQFDHGLVRAIHAAASTSAPGSSSTATARRRRPGSGLGPSRRAPTAWSSTRRATTRASTRRRTLHLRRCGARSATTTRSRWPASPTSTTTRPSPIRCSWARAAPSTTSRRSTGTRSAIRSSIPSATPTLYNRPYDRPQFPVGQTWQDPPKRQLLGFRRLAEAYGSKGVSWWSWQDTRRKVWPRLTGRLRGRPPGPKPKVAYANLDRGDRGDLVVWAQQLLIGRRIHVAANGRYGSKTERGVRTVQRRESLPVTGAINDATWVALLKRKPAIMNWSKQGNPGALEAAPPTASLAPLADEIPTPEERVR